MKKVAIIFATVAAFASVFVASGAVVVQPEDWFDAKVAEGAFPVSEQILGGAWTNGDVTAESVGELAAYSSGEVTFQTAVAGDQQQLDFFARRTRGFDDNMTIFSRITFSPFYDPKGLALPDLATTSKGAVAVAIVDYDYVPATNYFVVAATNASANGWVEIPRNVAAPVSGPVLVAVTYKTASGASYVKYTVAGTVLTGEGAVDGWFPIVADGDRVAKVSFAGYGTFNALYSLADPIFSMAVTSVTPGVDLTNSTIVATIDYRNLNGVDTSEVEAKLVVDGEEYTGVIAWDDVARKGTVTFGPFAVDPGADGTIVLDTPSGDEVFAYREHEVVSAILIGGWIYEYPDEETVIRHGNTGTWSAGSVWGEDGVAVEDSVFTATNYPSQGNVVLVKSKLTFGDVVDTAGIETTGRKAAIVIVPGETDGSYRFSVLSDGSNWNVIPAELFAPELDGTYEIKVLLNYPAQTVTYSVILEGGDELILGTFANGEAMGDSTENPVSGAGYVGAGLVNWLYGEYWSSNVVRDESGKEYPTIRDAFEAAADGRYVLAWDATYTPAYNHQRLNLDVNGRNFYPASDWYWTYNEETMTYRFNYGLEAEVFYMADDTLMSSNVVFLDEAIASAVNGDIVKVLMDVSNEVAFAQTDGADITVNLAGREIQAPEAEKVMVAKGMIIIRDESDDASVPGPGKVLGELGADVGGRYLIFGGWFDDEFDDLYVPAHYEKTVPEEGWWTVSLTGRFLLVDTEGSEVTNNVMPIFVPNSWIASAFAVEAANVDGVEDEAIVAKLNGDDANRLRTWQNYVLGLAADASLQLTGRATGDADDQVEVAAQSILTVANADRPDADIGVKYQFQYTTDVAASLEKIGALPGDETVGDVDAGWTNYGEPQDTPRLTVNLNDAGLPASTCWRVKLIFTEKETVK